MKGLCRLLRADFMKMSHTIFYWIHLIVPIIGVILFLGYYSYTNWNSIAKVQGYIQVLSIAFPFLISIICSFAVEQEALAGNFKELLSNEYGKSKAFLSKVCMLIICGLFSTILAVWGFGAGFHFVLKQNILPLSYYLKITLVIFGCQIFSYILHLILNFCFSKGASISVGIVGSLIAALMLTGLGDGIWQFVPFAWSGRLCDSLLLYLLKPGYFTTVQAEVHAGACICIWATVIMFISSLIWFSFYEGHRGI